ncbi:MAG TPA: hypothetical protein DCE42_24570, partial [Myxococcales bacterium]|nr:hypothetical protein [Myxococcales bacterium]
MMTFKKAALCISAAFFLTTSFAHANNTATSKPTTKAQLSKTNAIAKPKPPSKADHLVAKIKPGAITLMSNTTALLKSLIQYQELGLGLETRRLYLGLYRELWRKTSISAPNISPHKLLPLLPTMLKPLGIDLNKPFGIYAWTVNHRPILTFVVNTDKAVFLENLKKSGLNPHFVKHHGVDILVLGEETRSAPLGVFHGSTFTFALKNVPRRMAVNSNKGLFDLFSVVGKPANSPYTFIKATGKASLLTKLKARTIDHFLFVPNHNLFKRFRGMKMISGFLKQFALSYSLKDGAKLTLQLRGSSLVKTFLQPFQPPKGAKSWLQNIPQNAAWVSQAYLNVGKLLQLISNIGKMGILPPRGNMQLQMVTAMLNMQASGMGVNLDKWKKLMTGRIVTGMLWDKSSIERIKRGPNALFRGHLRGVFVALELADEAGAKAYFKQLQGVVTKLKSLGLKEFNALQTSKQTIDKKEVFSLAMPGVAPIYMTTHQNGVFILGHRATLDQFIAGWKGASLAELAKTPAYKQLTSLPAHFTWIQPA